VEVELVEVLQLLVMVVQAVEHKHIIYLLNQVEQVLVVKEIMVALLLQEHHIPLVAEAEQVQ
jgi:hypothetical protein